jgi:SAM-dependent methyltransferase
MDNKEYVLRRIERYFENISSDSHQDILGLDSYSYMSFSIDIFEKALSLITCVDTKLKFIDAGCGLGNMCGIASKLGFDAEGIELNPVLYNIAKQIYPELKFHCQNILNFDYSDYDVVYYALPFRNENLEKQLKEKIENEIKIGSYIITAEIEIKDRRFVNIHNNIWQKIEE